MLFPSLALGGRSHLGVGFSITAGLPVFHGLPPSGFVSKAHFVCGAWTPRCRGIFWESCPCLSGADLPCHPVGTEAHPRVKQWPPPTARSRWGAGAVRGAAGAVRGAAGTAPGHLLAGESPEGGRLLVVLASWKAFKTQQHGSAGRHCFSAVLWRSVRGRGHFPLLLLFLSCQVFLSALFSARDKLHAEPWGYILTLAPGCLCLQGTFLTLDFSRAQHSICRCFWELILTVSSSLGRILVLHSTFLQGLWAKERYQFFWWGRELFDLMDMQICLHIFSF